MSVQIVAADRRGSSIDQHLDFPGALACPDYLAYRVEDDIVV
jgi:hypothetical protein